MSEDLVQTNDLSTEQTAAEPDLRSVIADAVRTQREPDAEAEAKPEAPREAPEAEPDAERKDGRDEHGRFAPKLDQAAKPDAPKPEAAAPAAEQQQADTVATIRPPPGWSPASKAEFDKLPAHVQADIAKRETEVNQGFAKLAEYKDLEPLAALAKQNGTTLSAAVTNYRNFEVQLEKDFLGGIEMVCQRFGVHPASLAQAISQRMGGQQAQSQQQRQNPQFDPNTVVEQARAAMRAEMEQQQVAQTIQSFASDPKNLYFENVKGTMARLMQSELATSLEDAYAKACAMTPEVASLINQRPASADPAARQRAAADQARAASKATTGAPAFGIKAGGSPDANLSLRETIAAARDAQVGRA